MSDKSVSIIIPVFNRADILHETIDSILAQTYSEWQIIAVDDGSEDESIEVLKQYAQLDRRIKWYTRPHQSPKGANACRNYGFTQACGKYIKWVDSDDLLTPEALQIQVSLMESRPALQVCFGQGKFFNADTRAQEERWSRKISSDDIIWDYIRNNVRWPVGGPLWRKDYFKTPPFHEELKNSQEWLMHGLQLLKLKKEEFVILKEDLYLIRRGNIRMSSSRSSNYYFNQAKARLLLLKESFKHHTATKVKLELTKQILIYHYHSVSSRQATKNKY